MSGQKFFLHLRERRAYRMGACRGTNERQFCGYIHVVARRFARRRLGHERRRRRRWCEALYRRNADRII
jgi:hypothetical protein